MLGLMQDWPLLCHRIIDHAALNHAERPIVTRSVEGRMQPPTTRDPRAGAAGRQAPRPRRHQAGRSRRDARLEHLAASRSLVRHHGHRRGLSHRQSAAVSRADRLDHQSRRRPRAADGPDLRAAAGEARRASSEHRTLCGADRRGAHAGNLAAQRRAPTSNGSARSTTISPGDRSTRTPPPACATPPAPPATRRAWSIRIAPTCCRRWRSPGGRVRDFVPRRGACRWCRCSTPTAGRIALTAPMVGASLVMPGAKLDGASIFELLDRYRVSCTAAVPTVWLALLAHLEAERRQAPRPAPGRDRRRRLPALDRQDLPGAATASRSSMPGA